MDEQIENFISLVLFIAISFVILSTVSAILNSRNRQVPTETPIPRVICVTATPEQPR